MSNEMVERVAKAISLRDTTDEFAMARAAIEAMREPTYEMLKVGGGYIGDILSIWQDMIDEALKDD